MSKSHGLVIDLRLQLARNKFDEKMSDFHDDFLNPRCLPSKLDLYGARRGSLKAISAQLPNFHGKLLDIGCGRMPYKSMLISAPSRVEKYIGMDLPRLVGLPGYTQLPSPDLIWDGQIIPLEANSVECAICTEVFEYYPDVSALIKEIFRVLKTNGFLFFTSPFLWPLHDYPYDLCRYTPPYLESKFSEAGFVDIQMESRGSWDACLGSMIALWVRRRPLPSWKRAALSVLATPLVYSLTNRDVPPARFSEQSMLTGIAGTARKN